MTSLNELIADAQEDLTTRLEAREAPEDIDLNELAGEWVPDFYAEFYDIVAGAPWLATNEADIGGTPHQQIASNMIAEVVDGLQDTLREWVKEHGDDYDDFYVTIDDEEYEITEGCNAIYIYRLSDMTAACAGAGTCCKDIAADADCDPVGFLEAYFPAEED